MFEDGVGTSEIPHPLVLVADNNECAPWERALENRMQLVQEQRIMTRYRLSLVREADAPYDGDKLPHKVADFLHQILGDYPFEVMGALLVDSRHQAIGHIIPYMGTLNGADVEPRGIFSPAMLANAAAVLLFHAHPSGDPEPSFDDRHLTKRMITAGDTLGIKVLDHIILGEAPAYVSLFQREPW